MVVKLIQCQNCYKLYPPNTSFVRMANRKEVCPTCCENIQREQEKQQTTEQGKPKFPMKF